MGEDTERRGLRNKYLDHSYEKFEEEETNVAVTQSKRKLGMSLKRKGGEFLEKGSDQVTRRKHRQGR